MDTFSSSKCTSILDMIKKSLHVFIKQLNFNDCESIIDKSQKLQNIITALMLS